MEEILEKLMSLKPTHYISSWGGVTEIHVYFSYDSMGNFMTGSLRDKLLIPKTEYKIDVEKDYSGFDSYSRITEDYKSEIEKCYEMLIKELRDNISNNKSKIEKLINNRLSQLEKQKHKTMENQAKKSQQLKSITDKITSQGFQCSKVYSSNHHGTTVKDRNIADKFHKYIINDSKNIRFATVELKVNKDNIKIGVKLETRGEIGCSFEEFEDMYFKIKDEVDKLIK